MKVFSILLIAFYCVHSGLAHRGTLVDNARDRKATHLSEAPLVVTLIACETCTPESVFYGFAQLVSRHQDVTFETEFRDSHSTRNYHPCKIVASRDGFEVASTGCGDVEQLDQFVQGLKD